MKACIFATAALLIAAVLAWMPMRSPAASTKKGLVKQVAQTFKRLDKDQDGVLEAGELESKLEKHLDRIDRDKDGTINPDELQIWLARKEWQKERPGKGLRRGRGKSVLKVASRL